MILGVVQARMSSSRLQGKVMKKILGKPIIGYLFDRLKASKRITKIILATSTNQENDELVFYVQGLGFDVWRGSEEDVLGRFFFAAKEYAADTVVRITGDCPLIDTRICDQLIDEFTKRQVDYAFLAPTFAEGLDCEVLKVTALEKCHQHARLDSEREHVTPYIKNHKDQFKLFRLDNREDHSGYRIAVDEPEDFAMLEILFNDYYQKIHPQGTFNEIKTYLDKHPELIKMNSHVIRNEGYIKSLPKQNRLNAI